MINKEIINGIVCLEQTTYYIYRNEEDQKNGYAPFLSTSDKTVYDFHKNQLLNKELTFEI